MVDSRISIPLAMLKRDLADYLEQLLPDGVGASFDIPALVQYRLGGWGGGERQGQGGAAAVRLWLSLALG